MVNKYVILACGNNNILDLPRQLIEINGEPLIKRTIRLLKENGVKDIIITATDKRFDNLGATRYEPLNNDYDYIKKTGYWLSAFPFELMDEPVCFIWGDVYFSENAIKTIVETETKSNLFFCSYQNECDNYIKHHDEPFAYKVTDTKLFKKHINKVKKMKDKGLCFREPLVWELYRSMNGLDINEHVLTKNYVAINDESCDIDSKNDIMLMRAKLGGLKMIKCRVIKNFNLEKFDELKNLVRATGKNEEGKLYVNDTFECDEEMGKYLSGENKYKTAFIEVLEVIPEVKKKEEKNDSVIIIENEEAKNIVNEHYKKLSEEKKVKKTNKKKKDK